MAMYSSDKISQKADTIVVAKQIYLWFLYKERLFSNAIAHSLWNCMKAS